MCRVAVAPGGETEKMLGALCQLRDWKSPTIVRFERWLGVPSLLIARLWQSYLNEPIMVELDGCLLRNYRARQPNGADEL
jgi:hypothetical protein